MDVDFGGTGGGAGVPTLEISPFAAAADTAATSPAVEASGGGFNSIAFEVLVGSSDYPLQADELK